MRSFIFPMGSGRQTNAPSAQSVCSVINPIIVPISTVRSFRINAPRTINASPSNFEGRTARSTFNTSGLTGSVIGGEFVSTTNLSATTLTPWQDVPRSATGNQAILFMTRNGNGSADPEWGPITAELKVPDDSIVFAPLVLGNPVRINNIPAAETELFGTIFRASADFSGCTEIFASAYMYELGPAGSDLSIQYSEDEISWTTLCTWNIDTERYLSYGFTSIPVAMQNSVTLRVVTSGGNGSSDPDVTSVIVFGR